MKTNELVEVPTFRAPRLDVAETVGGYWRVRVHGEDDLQDGGRFAMMDIGRGKTKAQALAQAQEWFASILVAPPEAPQETE